ncbi:MAG: hypothetical protein HOW97_26090 [Catenulispora sp.]|nr:hypothetical protein [Catenulispora sp.]
MSGEWRRRLVVATAALASAFALIAPTAFGADKNASLSLSKEVFQPGTTTPVTAPLQPGEQFDYRITASCSGLTEGCINAKTVDVIPAGVTIEVPPSQPPLYTVDYDAGTRTLTVTYTSDLPSPPNPPGSQGLPAGAVRDLTIRGTVASGATDGETITNTATVTADNADPAEGSTDITVTVPSVVIPVATKDLSPTSVVAQSHAGATITLGVQNQSSGTAKVTSLTVGDHTAATWDDWNLTGVGPVTEFPAGANQVAVSVCPQPTPCSRQQMVTGPPQSGPALTLPAGVNPLNVTGVGFIFSNSAGTPLVNGGSAGSVELQVRLRDTVRSTGQPLNPATTLTQSNCATPSAKDSSGKTTTGADACAPYSILSAIPQIGGSKQFFADNAGTYTPNGYAVAGQNSGVTALVTATNTSQFAVTTMTLTEPSASAPSALTGIDVTGAQLTFPEGATSATGEFVCSDGSTKPFTLTAPPTTVTVNSSGCPAGTKPTKVDVTFSGSMPPESSATMGVHGTLNDTVTAGTVFTNCADASVGGGPGGTASGSACAEVTVEAPNPSINGSKSGSSTETGGQLVPGQPYTFTSQATNNGNLPMTAFTLTDPDPALTGTSNPFTWLKLLSATITTSPASLASDFVLEVDEGGTWKTYDASNTALLTAATGVRARLVSGAVQPTNTVTLSVTTTPRATTPPGAQITNCMSAQGTTAAGTGNSGSICSGTQTVTPPAAAGQVAKDIVPGTLPRSIAGVPPHTAQVKIRAANIGNIPMDRIVITDPDQSQADPTAFFDSVDLVGLDGVSFPPGADRVQVDACTSFANCAAGTYIDGTPGSTPVLPAGVTPGSVTGLRFTFTNSTAAAGQYLLTPGSNYPTDGPCPNGTVCFTVAPRVNLRSNPAQPIPDTVPNITAASGSDVLTGGTPAPFGTAPAELVVTPGSIELGTQKSAAPTSVAPGTPILYSLKTTNTGTGAVPALLVTEPIPPGLVFDPTFAGDNGQPYTMTSTVPAGTPPVPTPVFTPIANTRTHTVTSLRWQFPADFQFLPGSTVTLSFQATLAAGTAADTVVDNTFGAGTSDADSKAKLTCQNGATPDPTLGCTASAQVTARAGNALDAQKWVHGDDSLGLVNVRTGKPVPIDDPTCPVLMDGDDHYTRYPCVARVLAGQRFDFLLAFTNVGTTDATQTRLVDDLPKVGDTGVIVPGGRDTQWLPRPTLAAAPSLGAGQPGTLTSAYSPTSPGCTLDLQPDPSACPATAWHRPFDPNAESLREYIDFSPALPPGSSTLLHIPMLAPADLTGLDANPVAWNSFGHTDFFTNGGTTTQLPAVEPVKVGIAMPFGNLAITKEVAGPLPPGSKVGPFTVAYSCAVTKADGTSEVVATDSGTLKDGQTLTGKHIPAGAVCTISETDAAGAQSTLPGPVTIPAGDGTTAMTAAATVTNTFAAPRLVVVKHVTGSGAPNGVTYPVKVDCTLDGKEVGGYPKTVALADGQPLVLTDVPVGATCTAIETDTHGAAKTAIAYSDGVNAVIHVGKDATITVTNSFVAPTPAPPGPRPAPPAPPVPKPAPHRLPATGAALVFPVAVAVLAIVSGGVLLVAVRGRRRERQQL